MGRGIQSQPTAALACGRYKGWQLVIWASKVIFWKSLFLCYLIAELFWPLCSCSSAQKRESCTVMSKGLKNNSLESIYFHLQIYTSGYSNLHNEKYIRSQMHINLDMHSLYWRDESWCLSYRPDLLFFESQWKVFHPLSELCPDLSGLFSPYQTKFHNSLFEDFSSATATFLKDLSKQSVMQ